MMDELIERFPAQLREAVVIGQSAKISALSDDIDELVVVGMGGSGIGGDFVASIVRDVCELPYIVCKSYDLPHFVDKKTLVIVSSYSGNTEETLSAFEQARLRGAHIKCVASGGRLRDLAEKNGLDFIALPDDWPSPRACLGYSFVQQLFILYRLGLTSDAFIRSVEASAELLERELVSIKGDAERIATQLLNKTTVLYVEDRLEPVALRWRQQINENAKTLCWHHVVPEMNHNELVGWKARRDDIAVVMLHSEDDTARNRKRMDICCDIISDLTSSCIRVDAKGSTFVERMMYLVHLGDWVSWYLSQLRHVDAVEVDVIDYLKGELAKC